MKLSRVVAFSSVAALVGSLADCKDNESNTFTPPPDAGDVDTGAVVPPPQGPQPHTNRNAQPKVTECPGSIPASSSVCEVTKTGAPGTMKVVRGTVLAPDEVFHRGEVLIDAQGLIACVGCDCSGNPGYAAASVVACATGVISPGLVNPHEHLTYQNNKPVGHGELRYENRSDWQGGRGNVRLEYDSGANQTIQAYGELRFLMSGTTTIAGGGGVPGLIRNVDTSADDLEGMPIQIANSDVFPLSTPGKNLASGCDYSPGRTTAGGISQLSSYLPHISEGIDAEARNEFLCTSADGQFDLVQPQTGIIHGVALAPADAKVVQKKMAKIVWSPRSNVDLYGNTASAVMLDLAGVNIALGTDWIPSGSMNMLRELHCADSWNQKYFDKHFTDADLWRMATVNSAFAVGASHAIGMLKTGYLADLAIYDGRKSTDFRAILDAGVEDVALVLRGGTAMYGDDAVVKSAIFGDRSKCASFPQPVCGTAKAVCVDVRISANPSLTTILDAGAVYYPAFFCKDKTPDNEPSCHPSRSLAEASKGSVYTGIAAPDDKDGDGFPDAEDNCPAIFNPIRPMDTNLQADGDNDGIGDACDECPEDQTQKCANHPTSADLDSDGVPNGSDNCPESANPDQADGDSDGRGDKCDACAAANPGATPCPLVISQIRNRASGQSPKLPTVVSVEGFVSARKTNDFIFMQEGTTGAPYQGIYVLAGGLAGTASTGAAIGEKVRVTGMHRELFSSDQITAASIVITNTTAATMVPLVVTAGQVNTFAGPGAEPYESLLVRVSGPLTIIDDNPDTGPFFEFLVTGNLRVDDFIYARHGTPTPGGTACPNPCPYPPPGFTNGTSFSSITGVMGYSFSNRKLYPRAAADLAP